MILLNLPWPPSANRYYRSVNGRSILSLVARQYREKVVSLVGQATPLLGRLSLTLYAYPPDQRKRDLDNMLKQTLDALQHAGIFKDDSQIDRILIERKKRVEGGSMLVSITEE